MTVYLHTKILPMKLLQHWSQVKTNYICKYITHIEFKLRNWQHFLTWQAMRIHIEFSTTTIWTEGKRHSIPSEMNGNAVYSAQRQILRNLSLIFFDSMGSVLVKSTNNWMKSCVSLAFWQPCLNCSCQCRMTKCTHYYFPLRTVCFFHFCPTRSIFHLNTQINNRLCYM